MISRRSFIKKAGAGAGATAAAVTLSAPAIAQAKRIGDIARANLNRPISLPFDEVDFANYARFHFAAMTDRELAPFSALAISASDACSPHLAAQIDGGFRGNIEPRQRRP